MKYAQIEVTQHVIEPTGNKYRTYKWIGAKHLPVRIYGEFHLLLDELPFKLKKSHIEDFMYEVYFREDAYFPFGWMIDARIKLYNAWMWFFSRLAQMQMSDFTRADDCQLPEDVRQAVFDYRQFLRDCPDNYQTVEEIPFPGYMAQVDYKIVFVAEPYTLG